jgi:hypothetical protein
MPGLPEGSGRLKRPSLDQNYRGSRLNHLDFSGMDLSGKDFSWASVSYCDFRGAKFDRSNWRGAEIWNSQFDWQPPGVGDAVIIRDGSDTPGIVVKISYYAAQVLISGDRLVWSDVNVLQGI